MCSPACALAQTPPEDADGWGRLASGGVRPRRVGSGALQSWSAAAAVAACGCVKSGAGAAAAQPRDGNAAPPRRLRLEAAGHTRRLRPIEAADPDRGPPRPPSIGAPFRSTRTGSWRPRRPRRRPRCCRSDRPAPAAGAGAAAAVHDAAAAGRGRGAGAGAPPAGRAAGQGAAAGGGGAAAAARGGALRGWERQRGRGRARALGRAPRQQRTARRPSRPPPLGMGQLLERSWHAPCAFLTRPSHAHASHACPPRLAVALVACGGAMHLSGPRGGDWHALAALSCSIYMRLRGQQDSRVTGNVPAGCGGAAEAINGVATPPEFCGGRRGACHVQGEVAQAAER